MPRPWPGRGGEFVKRGGAGADGADAGHVGRVAADAAADVDEDGVVRLEHAVRAVVMRGRTVLAEADDGEFGPCAALAEEIADEAVDLEFGHAGPGIGEGRLHRLVVDFG